MVNLIAQKCFGFTLQDGCRGIGIAFLIFQLFLFMSIITCVTAAMDICKEQTKCDENKPSLRLFVISSDWVGISMILLIIANIIFLRAVNTKNRKLILYWVIMQLLNLSMLIFVVILGTIILTFLHEILPKRYFTGVLLVACFMIFYLGVGIYFGFCYYKLLTKENDLMRQAVGDVPAPNVQRSP